MDDHEDEYDPFAEALGVYVGPASYADVIEALTSVPPASELIVRIETAEGVELRHGWPEHFAIRDEDDAPLDLFVLAQRLGSEGL